MEENSPGLKVQKLEEKLNTPISLFVRHMNDSSDANKSIDKNFSLIESQLKLVILKLNKLSGKTSQKFNEVGNKLGEIKDELLKIEKVSNYPDEYENLLKIVRK